MKCFDVQTELWSGRKSIEIDEHLAACTACQLEMAEIGNIIGSLQSIDVPAPSRSLIPQREIIRDTVRRNRRKPWTKLSAIAVAATIIMGVGTGIALNQLQAPSKSAEINRANESQSDSGPGPQQKTNDTNIQVQTNEDPELIQAVKRYFEETAPAEGVNQIVIQRWFKDEWSTDTSVSGVLSLDITLHPDSTSTKFVGGPQKQAVKLEKQPDGDWMVVAFGAQAMEDPPAMRIENRVALYFKVHGNPQGVSSVDVVSFTPDAQTEERVMTGKVRLKVALVPGLKAGAASPYQEGINDMYVLLNKVQGVWDVLKIGPQPFQVSDAPDGVRDFMQVAQFMYGTVLDLQTSTREESGKSIMRLHTLMLKIDRNATTSNDPDKGKELFVALEIDLPPGYLPKRGDQVALFLAKGDPRVSMGMETWIGKREYYFYEKDGTYYDLIGNTIDPVSAYQKLQSIR